MRAELLALALLAAAPAAAADLGDPVRFGGRASIGLRSLPSQTLSQGGAVVFESGPSAAQARAGDTVLFHGLLEGADLRFEVSRRLPDGSWGPWQPAHVQRYPDGRFWGKAEVPYGRGSLRLRAVSPSGTARSVDIYAVETFTAGDREDDPPAPSGSPAAPPAGRPRPSLSSRQDWGAAAPKEDYEPQTPERITLHHTDGKYTSDLPDTLNEVKLIQDFHMNGRGWNDIGYHYLIDSAGRIVEGRPDIVIGAHAGDREKNLNNVGIAFLGSHHPPRSHAVTDKGLEAFLEIARWLSARYRIKPAALKGHRNLKTTDCPGDLLYARLPALRERLAPPLARAPGLFKPLALVTPRFE